jgi:hypothetical protein
LAHLKSLITKLLANMLGEEQLCGPYNYPDTDILTVLRNVLERRSREHAASADAGCTELCQRLAPPHNQLIFHAVRREMFLARKNVEQLLKSIDPIKYELNGWSRKPAEVVLNEILSVQK